MKIAILSCFHPFRGGIAQFNASLLGELSRSHTVRAFNFTRQYPSLLFPGRTQYVTDKDMAVPVESTALLDTVNPFSWAKTAREIRKWDPDVLIMRYWMSWFAPSLGYVARHMASGCKVIAIMDNVIPHEQHFFDKPLTRWFLGGVSGGVTLCEEVREDLRKIKPGLPDAVIPHPLYTHFGDPMPRAEAEAELGLKSGMHNIMFFGLIRKYKGLDILLEAFKGLPDDYQLIVAGEPYGPFDEYQQIIDSCPGKDRIHLFTEYIPDDRVKVFFSAADATVLPYRSATQSGVNAISCHFGVPMIVTDVGGLREMMGDCGLVAEKAEPECVRKEILRFFETPELRDRCSKAMGLERERLSWNRFCKDLTEFIESLDKK